MAAFAQSWRLSFASPQEAEDNASIRDSGVAKVTVNHSIT
jgi:hypothetical protein